MGLDAVVFCDCVEKDRLKSSHPFPRLLYIAPNGSPAIRSRSEPKIEQHDDWMHHACKHEDMMVGGDGLGNTSLIEFLRDNLRRAVRTPARDFPVLWKKVVYSGSHCGDHLTLANVLRLDDELKRLREIDFAKLTLTRNEAARIEKFRKTLASIVKTALKIRKPIAF